MKKSEAIKKLKKLVGKDLRPLASKFNITVWKKKKINKGWAGHTVERYLGLPLNSSRCPNLGSWELKVIPLKRGRNLDLKVKETMAITMIDPVEVKANAFKQSHLYTKLRRIILVARIFKDQKETASLVHAVEPFSLNSRTTYKDVKADYDLVRRTIRRKGFKALHGEMGKLVQPRTKGPGRGSISRAFYARTPFVSRIIGLKPKRKP